MDLGNGDEGSILEERTGISSCLDTWKRNREGFVKHKGEDELEMIPRLRVKVSVLFKSLLLCLHASHVLWRLALDGVYNLKAESLEELMSFAFIAEETGKFPSALVVTSSIFNNNIFK